MKISFLRHNTPRWLIFLIDTGIVVFSLLFAYLLRFNFAVPVVEYEPLPQIMAWVVTIRIISFIVGRTSAGIIRYTSTADAMRVIATLLAGSILFILTNLVTFYLINGKFFIPFSIIIIDFLVTTMAMITFRMIVKLAYLEFHNSERVLMNVIIYGAGEAGITTKRVLDHDIGTKFKIIAFIDDNPNKVGKKLEGVDIVGPDKIDAILEENQVANLILSIPEFDPQRKEALVDQCLSHDVKVMTVPPMMKWINGELSFNQIRKVNIEELLERPEIRLEKRLIREELADKVILITGAAGSIGSEIVRQAAKFLPKQLVLVDQAETALHNLELELKEENIALPLEFIIGDIRDQQKMERIFEAYHPEILYHAAAYKHVPMMEGNPGEAILTNVNGTRILADLSIRFKVGKFVMISTDKAVNPTNVMGASKRIAEIYAQSLNSPNETLFITTRFGNVLGSNGSVIPLFRSQIEKGGPITVTHPEITRFFMTIPEACQLVLEAGTIGKGGEIFIFDMGQSVRIVDLAKKMIRLSGLTLGKDIQIKFTGLRPGEKLYEELLNKEEDTLPTHHPRILVAKVKEYDTKEVAGLITHLVNTATTGSSLDIVREMKSIVPEFISQNSVFEKLDPKPAIR